MGRAAPTAESESAWAVDGDRERAADFLHAVVGEPAKALYEDARRHTFYGVEVHCAVAWDWIVAGFQSDLAGESADRCRARCDECSSEPRDRSVTRQDDDGPPAEIGKFAPPHLASPRQGAHEAPAASRNDARSPQSTRRVRTPASVVLGMLHVALDRRDAGVGPRFESWPAHSTLNDGVSSIVRAPSREDTEHIDLAPLRSNVQDDPPVPDAES